MQAPKTGNLMSCLPVAPKGPKAELENGWGMLGQLTHAPESDACGAVGLMTWQLTAG